MSQKKLPLLALLLCISCFIISLMTLQHIEDYAERAGISVATIYGGEQWVFLNWAQLIFIDIIGVFSGVMLLTRSK